MPDFHRPRHLSRSIWIAAALGAAVIHAGAVGLALTFARPEEARRDLGAPAIEIGVELTAPRLEPEDLPPGPNAEATAASPPAVAQKEEIAHSDLPKAVPTPTEDPDQVVAPSNTKTPTKDTPKVTSARTDPSPPSVASEATAPPAVAAARQASRSVAPAPGSGESARRERMTWERELAVHFDKYKRYPSDRRMQRTEVVVRFVLDRLGHMISMRVVKGSGDASFDNAALAMLQRSDPVPPPPPLVADEGLTFTMPVIFRVKGHN